MELNRRDFLKLTTGSVGGVAILGMGRFGPPTSFPRRIPLKKRIGEKSSICTYCAGGCGLLIAADGDKLVSIEGDPDHPVNVGALCSKAQAMFQVHQVDGAVNPQRATKVLYRAPNDDKWQEKTWDWALAEIAARIKQTRDSSWIEKDSAGNLVRRTEALASLGGAALDNEECYLIAKACRALGIVYLENQARI